MMIKLITAILLSITITVSFVPASVKADDFNPHFLVTDAEMTDTKAMSFEELKAFLDRGYLGYYTTEDYYGVSRSAAEIIWDEAQRYQINPQFVLTLLQREQSLVQDQSPSQNQLDWAMGYAVCDDCSKNDPGLQKYRGFGKQIHFALQKIREDYLGDLSNFGYTISGLAPGKIAIIDSRPIIPFNAATVVLYTYTPHLHGNANFVTIWQRWFRKDFPNGSLLQNTEDGGIWLIQYDKRRPITSRAAFSSRYQETAIIPVTERDLEAYEIGSALSFPNYSLLKTPTNSIFLLVDDTLRGIASWAAFQKIGFNPDEIIEVSEAELIGYKFGPLITEESNYPQGVLLQETKTGGIYYVSENQKAPILSQEILNNRFAFQPIRPDTNNELPNYSLLDPITFADGTLVAMRGAPEVYVIDGGKRRHIADEETFNGFGYAWANIIWTQPEALVLSPLGSPITLHDPTTPIILAGTEL